MKIEALFFAIILIAPVLNSNANATETVNKHAALIEQGCQMGREDAISGNIMDSSSISLKKSGDKYIELQALIRKEYEKCYLKNNSTVSGSTITNTPISSSVDTNSVSERPAPVAEEMAKKKPIKKGGSDESDGNSELKLPPNTSEKPFAWFYHWISVVEEAPTRYATEKKRAEDLRARFNQSCHSAYLVGQKDKTLIDRWCNITGWKKYKLGDSALHDDQFKKQLVKMKSQVGYSEEAFSKYGERDVKNAFDKTKGPSLNYQMENIEQQKVLPYLSGINVALGNIKATNIAMGELADELVAKRKKEYLAELAMLEKKRIEEKKKQIQSENKKLYLKQKAEADVLLKEACSSGKEDALNLMELKSDQYNSQAKLLNMIAGLEEQIANRYTECYDAALLSLTCKKAGEDFMKCRNYGPPSKYVSLASNTKAIHDFQAEYNKCYELRNKLYIKEKVEREKTSKNILKYTDIYRKGGGHFINDYNECVDSFIAATNNLAPKVRLSVLSNSGARLCEDESSLLENYASKSCSCSYGVVVETLSDSKFTEFSSDILALIKFNHTNIGNNKFSKQDRKRYKKSLNNPDASSALFKKIELECAM